MKYFLFIFYFFGLISSSFSQKKLQVAVTDLSFLEGKWKAISHDSSFSSELEYVFSPEKKILLAYNHIYGKKGQLFASYEGVYLSDGKELIFMLNGPNGEIHEGKAYINENAIVHQARINQGKSTKSYRSLIKVMDGKFYYYANYSKDENIPKSVDMINPLIYTKKE